MLRFASAHDGETEGALARFALGVAAFERQDYAAAAENLEQARAGLPKLADYVSYYLAAARVAAKDLNGIERDMSGLRAQTGPFPLADKAILLEADVKTATGRPSEAAALLNARYADLPQPAGDLALASNYRTLGQLTDAVTYFQRVYYRYPNTEQAAAASDQLQSARREMGAAYPVASAAMRLERVDQWIGARDYGRARSELGELLGELEGRDAEIARVRAAGIDALAGNSQHAAAALKDLSVSSPEADAERLYYLLVCARKQDDTARIMDAIRRLERYPQSPWREKALVMAGNHFLLTNGVEKYEPLYRAVYQSYPKSANAAYCHWKVAWSAYLRRRSEAGELMRDHVRLFPESPKASAALYFLGRLAEDARDMGRASALYREVLDRYPNYYYGLLTRTRISRSELSAAPASVEGLEFLKSLPANGHATRLQAQATAATEQRIARARLLRTAGFGDWAEAELRFGARNDGQPHFLAVEQARTATEPHRALQTVKSMAPDYLSIPLASAPSRFWQLMFPMPWRNTLIAQAKARSLDPYIVAGLIRQESEFNPRAISRAKAYGLTQVLPSTGRTLARNAGIRRFRAGMLFEPETNLRLGISYLGMLLSEWSGKWEEALASYNAGKGRVQEWMTWGDYREPAEFVETIPFTETREYVQAVLRNGDLYRRLYGGNGALAAVLPIAPPRAAPSKPAPAKVSAHANSVKKKPATNARRSKRSRHRS